MTEGRGIVLMKHYEVIHYILNAKIFFYFKDLKQTTATKYLKN